MKCFSSTALAAWFQPSHLRPAMRLAQWAMLALLAIAPLAGARGLDTTFATNGIGLVSPTAANFRTIAHLPAPSGGSWVVSTHQNANGCPANKWCLLLDRYLDNGSSGFQVWVPATANFTNVRAAAIDSQGRIVVVGSIMIASGPDHDFRIMRFTIGGGLDTTFNSNIGVPGIMQVAFDAGGSNFDDAYAVAIDSTDRIVVAGVAETTGNGSSEFAIARLTANGALDASFNVTGQRRIAYELIPGQSYALASAVAIDGAGRIVLGGVALDNLSRSFIGMARLLPNGDYDTSWCAGTCTANAYSAIHSGRSVTYFGIQSDQRNHNVRALAVNGSNQVAIVGNHNISNVTQGYAMTFVANGNWNSERSIIGGAADSPGESRMGGVVFASPSASNPDLIITGIKGNSGGNWSLFFAQCLSSTLTPRANWGNDTFDGENKSVVTYSARSGLLDPFGNVPYVSAIDAKGRVLMSGATPWDGGIVAGVAARLQNDAVFRDGFE